MGQADIRVSLFIEPSRGQLDAAKSLGAPVVELHTGAYCEAQGSGREKHLHAIRDCAAYGVSLGLEVHAGHGLAFESVGAIAEIPELSELNIGHFLVGEAIFSGLEAAIRNMRTLIDEARTRADASA